jgi:hypothetical protein
MAFHPRYFREPVPNTSNGYNYYEWNAKFRGASVTKLTKKDDRPLPKPTIALEREPETRIVCPVGGLILFSGQHMHSSVPNIGRDALQHRFSNSSPGGPRARKSGT